MTPIDYDLMRWIHRLPLAERLELERREAEMRAFDFRRKTKAGRRKSNFGSMQQALRPSQAKSTV